jgi:hypothetical protein
MKAKIVVPGAALAATGIGFAAPASAGCEAQVFAQYCDGPIRLDGTWDRCFQSAPQTTFGQFGQATGYCRPCDVATPLTQTHFRLPRLVNRSIPSIRNDPPSPVLGAAGRWSQLRNDSGMTPPPIRAARPLPRGWH